MPTRCSSQHRDPSSRLWPALAVDRIFRSVMACSFSERLAVSAAPICALEISLFHHNSFSPLSASMGSVQRAASGNAPSIQRGQPVVFAFPSEQ
jgi:hypothetical protein